MKSRYEKEIKNASERIFKAIKGDSGKKPSFYSLMAFKIQQKYWQKYEKYQDTVDYKYWQNNGWLQENCNFYMKHRANFFKIKFARLLGSIIAVFFI
jgi:hypothetical protein